MARSLEVLWVSYIIALSDRRQRRANDAQNVRLDTACGKEFIKNDSDIAAYISKLLQVSEDTIIMFKSS